MGTITHIEPGRPARQGQLILERRYALATKVFDGWRGDELLLDLGCGNGAQTQLFTTDVRRAVGVDITTIRLTEQPASTGSFDFILGDAGKLPIRSGSLDRAISFEVLEHVPDDLRAAREVFRVLKPGGQFIFSVPNKWWILESHGAAIPGLNWIPWNRIPFFSWLPTQIHERFAKARIYTMKRALTLARNAGFQLCEWGYITAPLDVLSEGALRRVLRKRVFNGETTRSPFLAVNLYVFCKKL